MTNLNQIHAPADAPNRPLAWGEAAPYFVARTPIKDDFVFSTVAGRFIVLCFVGTAASPRGKEFVERLAAARLPLRDDDNARFMVTVDIKDFERDQVKAAFPHNRIFHDPEGKIAMQYGLGRKNPDGTTTVKTRWYVLDPNLRVYSSGALEEVDDLIDLIRGLPDPDLHATGSGDQWAPVLLVPRVLEPEFCRELIDLYHRGQPEVSGFMRNRDGRTIKMHDTTFKRREDVKIHDLDMCKHLQSAIFYRLIPQIKKAFNFHATRIERYIVANYSSKDQGFFRPHRDNTTAGTAHRRFAVSINLNAEDFEGGDLNFPEYGQRTYRPPTGGAVVFGCSLLHQATPVTKGERYATLPFLYDDDAAKIREANIHLLADGNAQYKA